MKLLITAIFCIAPREGTQFKAYSEPMTDEVDWAQSGRWPKGNVIQLSIKSMASQVLAETVIKLAESGLAAVESDLVVTCISVSHCFIPEGCYV